MKKAIAFIAACAISAVMVCGLFAQSERTRIPRVEYLEPENDSVVDLAGKDSLLFRWTASAAPGGGRQAYRFRLYKGFEYGAIVSENLRPDVFSIKVPADKFEDGATYSWHVQQQDAANMWWGLFNTWSFKVSKKR